MYWLLRDACILAAGVLLQIPVTYLFFRRMRSSIPAIIEHTISNTHVLENKVKHIIDSSEFIMTHKMTQ